MTRQPAARHPADSVRSGQPTIAVRGSASTTPAPKKDPAQGQPDQPAPTEAAVRAVVEQLLELRPRPGTENSYDAATLLERERIRNRMRAWPPEAVRSALDLLLAGNAAGQRSLNTAESILDGVYAVKAPAEAAVLGMSLLERDPIFRRAARWSAAEWFRTDPEAARGWLAEQERSGLLESGGVEDIRRNVMREAEIPGLAQTDGAAAQRLLQEADPDTAFPALSASVGRWGGGTACLPVSISKLWRSLFPMPPPQVGFWGFRPDPEPSPCGRRLRQAPVSWRRSLPVSRLMFVRRHSWRRHSPVIR